MKRLGLYSGRIYEENEVENMEECGLCIADEEANDKEWIKKKHDEHIGRCSNCFGCPLSSKKPIFLEPDWR